MVSIIVPVYNAEKRLEICVESIMNQTYKNLEIILIDDGSKDNSGSICDRLAQMDNRIRVFHIENGGVSNARNFGLKNANGKYIQFVDSDDSLPETAVQDKVECIQKNNSQLIVANYFKECGDEKNIVDFGLKGQYSLEDFIKFFIGKHAQSLYFGAIWNKLYITDIIKNNSIAFSPEISLGEDFIFNLEYLKHCEKIFVMEKPLYNYFIDMSVKSLSRNTELHDNIWNLRKNILYRSYEEFFKYCGFYDKYRNGVSEYLINTFSGSIHDLYKGGKSIGFVTKIVKERRQDSDIMSIIGDFVPQTKKEKFVVFFIKHKLDMLSAVIYWVHYKRIQLSGSTNSIR